MLILFFLWKGVSELCGILLPAILSHRSMPNDVLYTVMICLPLLFYNIAGRATQSNSVYVSVLKIPIVLADGMSKRLCQNFFFLVSSPCQGGENIIFHFNHGYKQRLGPLAAKGRQFSDLFSWARVLKWGRKSDKRWKRKLGISAVTIRFTVWG